MTDEPASPVCYSSEVDDVYMGYVGKEELLAALNELLVAERAGARVSLASCKQEAGQAHRDLMRLVHADESRWCSMLSDEIRRLGASPSRKCGAFHANAMAILDPIERLAFLNRGQSWVVRKLDALMPRVRDDVLHGHLRDMADSHRRNLAVAEGVLGRYSRVRKPGDHFGDFTIRAGIVGEVTEGRFSNG